MDKGKNNRKCSCQTSIYISYIPELFTSYIVLAKQVVGITLHREEAGHRTRSALLEARATFSHVLLVVGSDNVLTRHSMVHLRLEVREEAIESPVEHGRSGEGVEIANGEKSLSTEGDTCLTITSSNDVVDETRHRRNAADEEGGHSSPVGRDLGLVTVHAVEIVHIGYRNVAASNDVVIGDKDSCHRPKEDGVTAEESKELCS